MSWLGLRSALCALAFATAACTSTTTIISPPPDNSGGTGDDGSGTPPASTPPATPPPPPSHPTAGKCTTSRAAEPLPDMGAASGFFAAHPMPQLVSQGGDVLNSPRVVPIFFKGDTLQKDIETFLGSVGCTDYWRAAVGEYKVGDALSAPGVTLSTSAPPSTDDSNIQDFLAQLITSKTVEAPTPNTIYTIFYPESSLITMQGGKSCEAFGGYHADIALPGGGSVAYAVVPRCANFFNMNGIDMVTAATSHELVEAATDPFPLHGTPAYGYVDNQHYPFMYVLGGGESGDLCAQEPDAFFTPAGYPFVVQRIWSNRMARAGKNPCTPVAAGPYFSAAPKLADTIDFFGASTLGVKVPAGTSKTIDLDLYSAGSDILRVDVVDDTAVLMMGPGVSTYSLNTTSGKNGDTLKLTISAPAGATNTELFAVIVTNGTQQRVAWAGAVGH